jgi:hypothetical protein
MDGYFVTVPTPHSLEGICYKADFNGDGYLDILAIGNDNKINIYLAKGENEYGSVTQSWENGYLELEWVSDNTTLYINDYNSDGREDIIIDSDGDGGISAILYADADGGFSEIEQKWIYQPEVESRPVPPYIQYLLKHPLESMD